ncbi:MAG TPA: hypothetical protein PLI45_05035 [Candidatus Woesebacteria bacterium]|nr:hypothetical protein [Candidatus Woesebacteria bacterium]
MSSKGSNPVVESPDIVEVLSHDQNTVLNWISVQGSGVTYIRDKAKRLGVEKPLSVIKELIDLGLVGKTKDREGIDILERLR